MSCALEVTYKALADGGYIRVDDVSTRNIYDGAAQAYVGDRCGVIRKQLAPGVSPRFKTGETPWRRAP